jgi:hypothetical protein
MPKNRCTGGPDGARTQTGAQTSITTPAAFEQILRADPAAYNRYIEERANAGAPGSGRAARYLEQLDELMRMYR